MERELGDDPTMVVRYSSSIALLQERFRRLQRDKQIREERELIRGSSGRTIHYDPSSATATACFFFHPELMITNYLRSSTPSPPQVVLSLWPNGSEVGGPKPAGNKDSVSIFMMEDESAPDDIDTSLHL